MDTVMSKKTYATKAAAEKACIRDGKIFAGTHTLPSGRVCYLHKISVDWNGRPLY